jgi:hypothetical protein
MFRVREISFVSIGSVRIKIDRNGDLESCARCTEAKSADAREQVDYLRFP